MLSPTEFAVDYIRNAALGLTLVLPRNESDPPLLVTRNHTGSRAILFDHKGHFVVFECHNDHTWDGILIPNVAIEVDETSIVIDNQPPLGSLTREDTHLIIHALENDGFKSRTKVTIASDLPHGDQYLSASFTKWQICLGNGPTKRVLKQVNVTPERKKY